MITVQQAVKTAWDYCANLYKNKISDMTLEEIEMQDDKYWLITLSYNMPERNPFFTGRRFFPAKVQKGLQGFQINERRGRGHIDENKKDEHKGN